MKLPIIIPAFLMVLSCHRRPDSMLKVQLDSVATLDQRYRPLLSSLETSTTDSLGKVYHLPAEQVSAHLWKLQLALDSTNLLFVEQIIARYGYPGKTLVGTPANETAWYVIQHSPAIKKYFSLIRNAGNDGELPLLLVATMEDRMLMQDGLPQLYGTQASNVPRRGGAAGFYIWPIKDPKQVNERRKQMGFTESAEQNATRLGIEYRVVRMDEIAQ